jgi:Protein of unknown function (DUF3073)
MGRGRAKAKQTKVARELKYSSPSTDLTALQRELAGVKDPTPAESAEPEGYEDYGDDRWASSS